MNRSILQLPQLELLLKLWYHENLIAKARGLILESRDLSDYQKKLLKIAQKLQVFDSPIKGYSQFINTIKNGGTCDDPLSLVRDLCLSQEEIEKIPHLSIKEFKLLAGSQNPLMMIPYALGSWTHTKKVISVRNFSSLEMINPSERSYFDQVPYTSFVLHLPEEIQFESDCEDVSWSIAIVTKGEYFVSVLLLNDRVSDFLLSEIECSKMRKILCDKNQPRRSHRVDKLRQNYLDMRFRWMKNHIHPPVLFFLHRIKELPKSSNNSTEIQEIKTGIDELLSDKDVISMLSMEQIQTFNSLLNGLCKWFVDYSERIKKEVTIVDQKSPYEYVEARELGWWEIPVTKIEHLEAQQESGIVSISKHSGFEMSPHVRRGHWRTLIKKDGTKESIWIDQTTVRKDKLSEGESVKASATVIK